MLEFKIIIDDNWQITFLNNSNEKFQLKPENYETFINQMIHEGVLIPDLSVSNNNLNTYLQTCEESLDKNFVDQMIHDGILIPDLSVSEL